MGHSPPQTFSYLHGSLLCTAVLPETACSSTGIAQSQPFSGAVTSSRIGFSTGGRLDSAPPLISKGCTGSACHLIVGQRGMNGCSSVPPSLLSYWSQYLHSCLYRTHPQNKRVLKTKITQPTCLPILNMLVEALFGSALARGRTWSQRSFLRLLTDAYSSRPLIHYQNTRRYKPNTMERNKTTNLTTINMEGQVPFGTHIRSHHTIKHASVCVQLSGREQNPCIF